MHTDELAPSLVTLFRELVHGTAPTGGFVLNSGDPGLLASLGRLSAEAASATPTGGAPIAAHVAHVRYGLSLMNRWADGEDPFADADWAAAWRITGVTEDEWRDLRTGLRAEAEWWLDNLGTARSVAPIELNGMIASVVHLAYHVGAMRQVDRALRGPAEPEVRP
jgi:hypothetical protein